MATPQRSLMMEIEIKFGKGRSDRVKVHYDDDADLLAEEFVRRHKLKETSKPVIAQYISSTMENFLSQPRRAKQEKKESYDIPRAAEGTPLNQSPSADGPARFSPHPSTRSNTSEFFPSENVRTPPLPVGIKLSRPSSFLTVNSDTPVAEPSTGELDETDLMSQITRSLSLSMDYKQYQENVDRRMSMRTFSFKDIASEVAVLTKEPTLSDHEQSVDSDVSTVHVAKPHATSVYDAPILERGVESDVNNHWNNYAGIGYGSGDARRSSGRYALSTKEPLEDISRGAYTSLDNWPELSPPKSRSHLGSRDSTSHFFGGDSHSEARDELMSDIDGDEASSQVSAVSEGPSAEEMYNRAKMSGMQRTLAVPVQSSNGFSQGYGQGYGGATAKVLKPSSSTMQLGLQKSSLSSQSALTAKNDKSLVGKSANERLYNAAQLDRDKRSRRAKMASDIEIKALDEGKFKLNNNSKKIVANLRPKGYSDRHIGERLYEEGVVEKQLKAQRADELQGKLTPEEWSCAKCGTFQMISKASVEIQPLHQMQNKAHIQNKSDASLDGKPAAAKAVMVCKECGWDQGAVQAHRPVNIALAMNDDSEELLQGRWQGNPPVATEGGIHQYLYENARTRVNIQQLNRVLWNEAHSGLTFAPALPESSNEILEKYKSSAGNSAKTVSSMDSSAGFSDPDAPPSPAPLGLHRDGKNILAGPAIGAYLQKSATERLSTTQTRPITSNIPRHGDGRRVDTESQASSFNRAGQGQFVNRLVYEYKDKRERQQKDIEFANKHDINTGELLFQPKVGPDPEDALGFGSTAVRDKNSGAKRNVFDEIMVKDQMLKVKRKEAEDKAVAHMMKELSDKQVRALDSSHQILQQSTQNNIEELFQVLLEAQQHIIQDGRADTLTESKSPEPEWKSFLVDLDMINTDMMIAEVGLLLNEIRAYKMNHALRTASNNAENLDGSNHPDSNNMLVSFDSFRALVLKCMKRRDGTGRSYVYVPKKKADVTMQMIQNNLKEETFRPTIDKNSATLCLRRHKDLSDYPIEDVLQVEGERIRSKWESARQARILQDSRELTFKPKLFKPPSYIKPKYWGMEEMVTESDSEGEGAPIETARSSAGHDSTERGRSVPDISSVASSAISSEMEPQVLQMPALQARPPTNSDARAHQTSVPLPSEISPVRRDFDTSPDSKNSEDEHSINTISTTFTTEEPLRRSSGGDNTHGGGRSVSSVSSAVPLVTRRYTGSLSRGSSSAQNSSMISSKSASSVTRKVIVVNKPPSGGRPNGAVGTPAAPPMLPHEIMQQRAPPSANSSSGKHGWKGGRVSDASELTSSTELSRHVSKQR